MKIKQTVRVKGARVKKITNKIIIKNAKNVRK